MVDARPAPLFGQTVGETQRALRSLLDSVLDAAGVSFEDWVVLNSLATQGPSIGGARLRDDLADALELDQRAVSGLLAALAADGRISVSASGTTDERVELSPDGAALHGELRAAIARRSAAALAGIEPREVETTISVLQRVKAQAQLLREPAASA